MNMKYLSPQFYIKSTSENGHIEGYASVFNVRDELGDSVAPGAFRKSLEKFQATGKLPKMLWQHDSRKPIGIWEEIYEDQNGLFVKGKLLLDLKRGREAWSLLKNKAIDGLSIGYRSAKKSSNFDENILSDIDLLEISIVTFPACAEAVVESVKSNKSGLKNKDMPESDIETLEKRKVSKKLIYADQNEPNIDDENCKIDVKNIKKEVKMDGIKSNNFDENIAKSDQRIEAFADLIKAVSRLTQMIYQFLR